MYWCTSHFETTCTLLHLSLEQKNKKNENQASSFETLIRISLIKNFPISLKEKIVYRGKKKSLPSKNYDVNQTL